MFTRGQGASLPQDALHVGRQRRTPTVFPQDIAACHAMLTGVFQSLEEKDQRIDQLEELVDALLRERFGRKSERYDPNQLALFTLASEDDAPMAEPAGA